ncbi:MAG: copper homeostasis protein CutC [Zavarzinella sp.]
MQINQILLEVCVGNVADGLLAAQADIDRLEVNSALEMGGLTPNFGTVRHMLDQTDVPLVVMLRPRGGDFCYCGSEITALLHDLELFQNLGINQFIVGCLTSSGMIDQQMCEKLMREAPDATWVFSRAIDTTADYGAAFESVVELGFHRILTSGGAATAPLGSDTLREMHNRFGDEIGIVAGCGINQMNVSSFLQTTALKQIHGSFSTKTTIPGTNEVAQRLDFHHLQNVLRIVR